MLNGAKVANAWQPMSAEMCVGPSSRCVSLIAANTGRSGQPVQKFGGRGGSSPTAAIAAPLWPSSLSAFAEISAASMPAGFAALRKFASPRSMHLAGVFAGLRQRALAVDARLDVGAAQLGVHRLLDVVRDSPPRRSARRVLPRQKVFSSSGSSG